MKSVNRLLVLLFFCAMSKSLVAQTVPGDTVSKFDKFNAKMERAFKILPAPIITYSSEAGNTFGLAKFNVFQLSKKDTISRPSKLSEVVAFSTKGRINISISNDLIFNEDKWMILSFLNYKKTPEFILGIGNDVTLDNVEEVTIDRFRFSTTILRRVAKSYYAGISLDLSDYFRIETDSNSFLIRDGVPGVQGGTDFGIGFSGALDSRDNRYNASKGAFLLTTAVFYPKGLGSHYEFVNVYIDGRKYFNPWHKHVIAVQATTMYSSGDVPFYDLSMMGGEDRMRGYYKGAVRDKVLVDAQIEYRMPIWNIFGITGFVGTGRVMDKYSGFNFDGLWLSYGGGIRIRVDSKNNTNLRFDMGFGPNGVSGFYFNFAEAF